MAALLQARAPAPQPADRPAERVAQAETPGLKIGFRAANEKQSIEERVPERESVHDWSRMVTTQRLGGLVAQGLDAAAFAAQLGEGWLKACPAGKAAPLQRITVSGRAAVTGRLDCPLNRQTGKPETMFLRMITGTSDVYSVQVAFRSVPNAQDIAWAEQHLASVRLCGAADADADAGCR